MPESPGLKARIGVRFETVTGEDDVDVDAAGKIDEACGPRKRPDPDARTLAEKRRIAKEEILRRAQVKRLVPDLWNAVAIAHSQDRHGGGRCGGTEKARLKSEPDRGKRSKLHKLAAIEREFLGILAGRHGDTPINDGR